MELWCGSEDIALQYARMKVEGTPAHLMNFKAAGAFEEDDFGLPPIAQMVGNTSVIKVSGGLVPGQAGWRRLFGMIGYDDIKGAMLESVKREDAEGIILYVDSPGGAVNGLEPMAKFITEVGKIKPVVAYAASAASAAYWMACKTKHITASETSQIGSIGVIMQLVNLTDRNAQEGIKYHIFKSGSLKMAGNPNEDMSEEAKKYFQQMVEDSSTIFYKAVSEGRNIPLRQVRSDFGDGRTFLGARALAYNLIDKVGGMEVSMRHLQSLIAEKKGKR